MVEMRDLVLDSLRVRRKLELPTYGQHQLLRLELEGRH